MQLQTMSRDTVRVARAAVGSEHGAALLRHVAMMAESRYAQLHGPSIVPQHCFVQTLRVGCITRTPGAGCRTALESRAHRLGPRVRAAASLANQGKG